MQYRAIIVDVDGTSVPNAVDATPTPRVLHAIRKAQQKVHVCACTSRPIFIAQNVIRALEIKDLCGINDATQIYDAKKEKIIKTFSLSQKAAKAVRAFFRKKKIRFMVNAGKIEKYDDGSDFPDDLCSLCVPEVPIEKAMKLKEELTHIPDIAVQTPPSYKKGNVWVSVTSATATKLHSVLEITKRIGVDPKDTIGIGDGYNDYPLLSACGLKIAMGNAVPELKAIADFIAPTVEEDGVAVVIEKFILND